MNRTIILFLISIATLFSCSSSEDSVVTANNKITIITSTGGLGDNGYNDLFFNGIIKFASQYDIALSIITPKDKQEALTFTQDWCREESNAEKSLLILCASEYESFVNNNMPQLTDSKSILIIESNNKELPDNTYSLKIRRYGACWLCGKMAAESPCLNVIAANPNDNTLQEAIMGLKDGYTQETALATATPQKAAGNYAATSSQQKAAGNYAATSSQQKAAGNYAASSPFEVIYIKDNYSGYNNPEKAYSITKTLADDAFIVPLAGGSNSGIYKYARENMFCNLLIAGMDVNCSSYSTRTPFSIVITIEKTLDLFLDNWLTGNPNPKNIEGGLEEGFIEIQINNNFLNDIRTWSDYYLFKDYWQKRYQNYYQSAKDAERRYYEK